LPPTNRRLKLRKETKTRKKISVSSFPLYSILTPCKVVQDSSKVVQDSLTAYSLKKQGKVC
jgi:hypothetical protein